MSRWTSFFLLAIALLALHARAGYAALRAELAYPDAPRSEHVESLRIFVSGLPSDFNPSTLRVRDARGGPAFERSVSGGGGEFAVLMPLPFVAGADLPIERWPIVVTLRAPDGREMSESLDLIRLPISASGVTRRVLAVGAADSSMAATQGAAPIVTRLAPADFLQTPPLALAGFDEIRLDAHTAGEFSESQALGLMNCGLRLFVQHSGAPAGALGRIVWDRAGTDGTHEWWTSPRAALDPIHVLEPGLARARPLQVRAALTPGAGRMLLSIVPIAALLVVLMRLMIHRTRVLLGVITVALIIWSGIAVTALAFLMQPTRKTVAWTERAAPSPSAENPSGGSALSLDESFSASSSLVARDLELSAHAGELVFPTTAGPRGYFALEDAVVALDRLVDGQHVQILQMHISPRHSVIIARRSVHPTALTPPYSEAAEDLTRWGRVSGIDSANAWRIESGYVSRAAASADPPQVFSTWAQAPGRSADLQHSSDCWYQLRFDGRHRYFAVSPTAAEPRLLLVDFGAAPPDTLPSTAPASAPSP